MRLKEHSMYELKNTIFKRIDECCKLAGEHGWYTPHISFRLYRWYDVRYMNKISQHAIAFIDPDNTRYIHINRDIIDAEIYDYKLLKETIPHEIAHIICLYYGWETDKDHHNDKWKYVCKTLGGNGERHFEF